MDTLIGLDIGSHNIKLVELARDKRTNVYTLLSAGSMPAPQKSISSPGVLDDDSLVYIIKQLVKDTGSKSTDVCLSLPDAQVFTRVIEVPPLSSKELMSAIKWEAEQYIPLPLDQVNIDYSVLRNEKETGSGKMDILLAAAPKNLVNRYVSIVEQTELLPVAAEPEIIATSRALAHSVAAIKYAMIISIGAQTTGISILQSGFLMFTRSVSAGGDALTRALIESMDFSSLQAEEYKKTYGLNKSVLEGKIFLACKPVLDTVIEEMKRAVGFFGEHRKGESISAVLLSGGGAKLPGLVSYITESLGIETQLANPWVGIRKDPRFSVLDTEGSLFTVAAGLALRE